MQTNQQGLLFTPDNVNETHKDDSNSVKADRIENSPFTLITRQGKSFVVMGDYRITEEFNTPEEALNTFEEKYWSILVTVITVVVEKYLIAKAEIKQFHVEQEKSQEEASIKEEIKDRMERESGQFTGEVKLGEIIRIANAIQETRADRMTETERAMRGGL